ncbi:MAG TPA: hypothetical protein VIE67_08240 [Rudaea sp.]|jgi:hypothetical protein|uniref:hypothetical protein n=1 Tax=Rudaea sp. TaxID=2136325 RepID=UPI002F952F3D
MRKIVSSIARRVGLGRLSTGEYQAHLSGMDTFFGAVLGFVLAGTETLNNWQFGLILLGLAGVVISILYISASVHRLVYSIYALVMSIAFPVLIDVALRGHDLVPDKVRPTLIVWTLMTIAVEFWAREKPGAAQA